MEFPGHPDGTRFTDPDDYLRSSFRRFSYAAADDRTPRAEAYALASHGRLGVDSPLAILPYNLYRQIGISSFAEGREIRENERVEAEAMRIASALREEANQQWATYRERNYHYEEGVTTPADVYMAQSVTVGQLQRDFSALEQSWGYDRQGVSAVLEYVLPGIDPHTLPRTTLQAAMDAPDFDPAFA